MFTSRKGIINDAVTTYSTAPFSHYVTCNVTHCFMICVMLTYDTCIPGKVWGVNIPPGTCMHYYFNDTFPG